MEIWKDVVGYEDIYQVSSLGRVKSLARKYTSKVDKILIPAIRNQYPMVELFKNSKGICFSVHRLVAIAFLGIDKDRNLVNHINKIKTDNRIENLEWVNQSENDCHKSKFYIKTSKFPGVHFDKSKNRFIATAYKDKKQIKLGTFIDEIEAYNSRIKFYQDNSIENRYL